MTDGPSLPIPDRVHSAAAAWIVRSRSEDPAVQQALLQWLDSDPRHRVAFDEAAAGWDESVGLSTSPLAKGRQLPRAPFYMRRSTHLAAAAMSAAVIAGVSVAWLAREGPLSAFITPAEAETFATAVGEIRTIKLGDGTVITLDTSSKIRVERGATQQRLELEQGRVRVRPSRNNTAVAIAGNGSTATLEGSAFDIALSEGSLTIVAVEGQLILHGRNAAGGKVDRILIPGQIADVHSGVVASQASADVQWVEGMLVLDRTPLANAVAALNRYNRVQVILDDPLLGPKPVTGAFRSRDPDAFARALTAMFDLRIARRHPDEILLTPHG